MSRLYAITFGTAAVIGLVVIIVSIATVSWVFIVENENGTNKTRRQRGLFSECTEGECEPITNDLHIAVQVLTLISTLAQVAGTIIHIIQECHKAKPHLIHWIATFFSLSAGAMFTAMSIFTSIYHPRHGTSYGFSYILGWVSFLASFVLAILAIVKAVKEAESAKGACRCKCSSFLV